MPVLVLPANYESNRSVTQSPYEMVLTVQENQSGGGLENRAFDTFLASIVEAQGTQLEMFSREIVDECGVFRSLVADWRSQRGSTSSTTEMVLCPAYQSIIGMGPKAIPLILARLVLEGHDPDHWFWALQAITGANPVSEEDEGNLRRMSRAWLDWAASEGYAW